MFLETEILNALVRALHGALSSGVCASLTDWALKHREQEKAQLQKLKTEIAQLESELGQPQAELAAEEKQLEYTRAELNALSGWAYEERRGAAGLTSTDLAMVEFLSRSLADQAEEFFKALARQRADLRPIATQLAVSRIVENLASSTAGLKDPGISAGLQDAALTTGEDVPSDPLKAWQRLVSLDLRGNPAYSARLFEVLTADKGREHLEELLIQAWPFLHENGRRNVAYSVHDPDGPSTETVVQLFRHPESRVEDRHRLLAGLAATADERGEEAHSMVAALVSDIGSYEDQQKQKILEGFQKSVRGAFVREAFQE